MSYLQFDPLKEEEILNLLPKGEYDFVVFDAEETVSKTSGNPMIKLTLEIFDGSGRRKILFDYLMNASMYKIKHFCDSTGLQEKYEKGGLCDRDCVNMSGRCKVIVQSSPAYQDKNSISDYVKKLSPLPKNDGKVFIDSEIPF